MWLRKRGRTLNFEENSSNDLSSVNALLLSADQKTIWSYDYGHESPGQPVKVPFSGQKVIVKIQCAGPKSAILWADGRINMFEFDLWWFEHKLFETDLKFVDLSFTIGDDGFWFILALTDDNRLYAFGDNLHGQCGQGTTSNFQYEPVEVKNLNNLKIKQISAGKRHCLIKCAKRS